MKNILIKAITCLAIISFTSCQNETVENDVTNKDIKITEMPFEALSHDLNFQEAYLKTLNKAKINTNNISNKTVMENQYGFTIADKLAKVVTIKDVTSYTMLIKRENQNSTYFENLVVQIDASKKVAASIIKYTPSEMQLLDEHHSFAFNGTTSIVPIDYNATATNKGGGCVFIDITMCNYGGREHIAGSNCTRTYVVTKTLCAADENGGSGGTSSGNGGTGDSGSGGYGGTGGTGGTGSTTTNNDLANNENNPVVTSPVSPSLGTPEQMLAWQTGFFINTLPNNLKAIFTNNTFAFTTVMDYVTQNGLTAQTKENIKNALIKFEQIVNIINSPNMTIDEIENFQRLVIKALLDNPTSNFTASDYPGKDDGMPFEWWKNENYIKANLKIAHFSNALGQTPNEREIKYFIMFPVQALLHVKNSNLALNTANQLVANGTYTHIHNGKGDSFRHTYWNAFDTAQFGATITKLFTDAHEWNSGNNPLEAEMDFYNNQIGRDLGSNISSFATPNHVQDVVIMSIFEGEVKYISPLDVSGNIISNSRIKFTNQ